jgi:hypothetical protein
VCGHCVCGYCVGERTLCGVWTLCGGGHCVCGHCVVVVGVLIVGVCLDTVYAIHRYTLSVWAEDQAGWTSTQPATLTWQVVAVAPSVSVLQQPDAVSAAWRPAFVVAADWGSGVVPVGGQEAVVLEFLLVGDKERGRCGVGSA